MNEAYINLAEGHGPSYYAGDIVKGTAIVTLAEQSPVSNVAVSLHCVGEVKWTDQTLRSPFHLTGGNHYSRHEYLQLVLDFDPEAMQVEPYMDLYGIKKVTIPFEFEIPTDRNLPSSMICRQGSIHYFLRVSIRDRTEVRKFIKELVVQAPMQKNLMLTVGGQVEKAVLLHSGTVGLHATIGRKGFAPGETVTVHVAISNRTLNARVVPRASLRQVQIYMSGIRHNTIETILGEPVTGKEVAPSGGGSESGDGQTTKVEQLLDVLIPPDESLSIKSTAITVKYFVHVTLDIPHAFDLHLNLPIVVTSRRFIEQLRGRGDGQPPALIEKSQ